MTAPVPGAAIVGRLTDVPVWEANMVLNLRLWTLSPDTRAKVCESFAQAFGAEEARVQLDRFATFVATACAHARRPVAWHGLGCQCIGADEALLATAVREAAAGDVPEAALTAALLVRAAHAEPLALMAGQIAEAQHRLARQGATRPEPGRVLH